MQHKPYVFFKEQPPMLGRALHALCPPSSSRKGLTGGTPDHEVNGVVRHRTKLLDVRCIDIKEFRPMSNDTVDFVIGGPPCQTFSAAGRRAEGVQGTSEHRGLLFEEYVRLVLHFRPRGFLFENVYGITGAEGGLAWRRIRRAFEEAG